MKPLKDIYTNEDIFRQLADDLHAAYPPLKKKEFFNALVKGLDQLELKARLERAADTCRQFLPSDYPQALDVLYKFAEGKDNRLVYLFLPMFVAKYGLGHYRLSMKAIRDFTQYSSSEEGVRAFLCADLKETLRLMNEWTRSTNTHIRRLASEGCRPRLPWAGKIPALIEQPGLTWTILETLKADPEKYVQKSVANHINDISKDHPDWVVERVRRWDLSHPSTEWIVRHGTRSLIKQGHKGALALFGHARKPNVKLQNVRFDKTVRSGETARLTGEFVSAAKQPQPLVIDYRVHFCKKSGAQNPKTFKWRKITLGPGETIPVSVKYTFKDLTTRKHYPGPHAWQFMINGEFFPVYSFHLKK
ncbi:MAG: DNA alkylation repair protein [Candidatus Omnitrophota bacterium]